MRVSTLTAALALASSVYSSPSPVKRDIESLDARTDVTTCRNAYYSTGATVQKACSPLTVDQTTFATIKNIYKANAQFVIDNCKPYCSLTAADPPQAVISTQCQNAMDQAAKDVNAACGDKQNQVAIELFKQTADNNPSFVASQCKPYCTFVSRQHPPFIMRNQGT